MSYPFNQNQYFTEQDYLNFVNTNKSANFNYSPTQQKITQMGINYASTQVNFYSGGLINKKFIYDPTSGLPISNPILDNKILYQAILSACLKIFDWVIKNSITFNANNVSYSNGVQSASISPTQEIPSEVVDQVKKTLLAVNLYKNIEFLNTPDIQEKHFVNGNPQVADMNEFFNPLDHTGIEKSKLKAFFTQFPTFINSPTTNWKQTMVDGNIKLSVDVVGSPTQGVQSVKAKDGDDYIRVNNTDPQNPIIDSNKTKDGFDMVVDQLGSKLSPSGIKSSDNSIKITPTERPASVDLKVNFPTNSVESVKVKTGDLYLNVDNTDPRNPILDSTKLDTPISSLNTRMGNVEQQTTDIFYADQLTSIKHDLNVLQGIVCARTTRTLDLVVDNSAKTSYLTTNYLTCINNSEIHELYVGSKLTRNDIPSQNIANEDVLNVKSKYFYDLEIGYPVYDIGPYFEWHGDISRYLLKENSQLPGFMSTQDHKIIMEFKLTGQINITTSDYDMTKYVSLEFPSIAINNMTTTDYGLKEIFYQCSDGNPFYTVIWEPKYIYNSKTRPSISLHFATNNVLVTEGPPQENWHFVRMYVYKINAYQPPL